MPFEWFVAIRYLRDGKGQTALILAAVSIGVSVIVFLSALITGLQTSLIDKTLGSQPHITLKVPREVPRPLVNATPERAIAVTLSIYALLLLPGAYLFWRDGPEPWTSGQVYEYLETLYVATGLYLPLLYAIAVLRESYQLVSMRAARLERDADIDALTAIPNRRALTRTLSAACSCTAPAACRRSTTCARCRR